MCIRDSCKADLDLCTNVYTLVDEDFTLLPGLDVVQLPGHTPGLMGLIVRLAGGTVLLPQDCVYTAANYGPPVRRTGSAFSWDLYHSSIQKLRTLQEQTGGLVIFCLLYTSPRWAYRAGRLCRYR